VIRMSHGNILLVLLSFIYLCFWTIFVFIENRSVGFEVLVMKSFVFWDIMPCSLLKVIPMSVDFKGTTRHHIPEDRTLEITFICR
jgi:hypothetical protein